MGVGGGGGDADLVLNQKQYIIKGKTCGIGLHLVFYKYM